METTKDTKEKVINVNKWLINESLNLYLISYTATWCGPCKKIKPTLLNITSKLSHKGSKEIPRNKKPEHVKFIPWFDILDTNNVIINSVQTSDSITLNDFLKPFINNNINITDDF